MPCKITYEAAGLYAKFTGVLTPKDVVTLANVIQSPVYADSRYRIIDFLEVTNVCVNEIDLAYVHDLEFWFELSCSKLLRVVVAKLPTVVNVLDWGRPLHARAGSFALFSSLEDARHWIAWYSDEP